ncbi:hypothetical protein DFR38_10526 [Aquitalea magnusonii]|uniref:Uncharacterized protein n=1 Tax=Aquitalea magnusonii TaxID=332411 RepID=A0A318JVI0_9NEIS|nr:hypothetical protein DFR38_10526 [Aquitalea magnusonii]
MPTHLQLSAQPQHCTDDDCGYKNSISQYNQRCTNRACYCQLSDKRHIDMKHDFSEQQR